MSNDAKIKEFRTTVEAKREQLGSKPKLAYTTNASLDLDGERINLNTLGNEEACVKVTSQLLAVDHLATLANEMLGTKVKLKFGDFTATQWIEDIKLRVKLIQWEVGYKKLIAMDKKLAALRSEDAKTTDAIADIAAELE